MCPSIKLDDDCKILGLLTKVVLLGDSNVGVIRPASFYNESGHREVIWKMKGL